MLNLKRESRKFPELNNFARGQLSDALPIIKPSIHKKTFFQETTQEKANNTKDSNSSRKQLNKGKLFLLTLLALGFAQFSNHSFAADAQSESQAKAKKWSITASSSYAAPLFKEKERSRSAQITNSVTPVIQLGKGFSAGSAIGVTTELSGLERTLLNDGSLFASYKGWSLTEVLHYSPTVAFTLPLSKRSQKGDNLFTALTISNRLSANLSKIGLKNLSASYGLSATRAFHKYTTAYSGAPRKQHHLSNTASLSWSPIKRLSLAVSGAHTNSWSYRNFVTNSFSISESLAYGVTDRLNLSLSHSNGGNTLKVDGQSSNVAFLNEESSVFAGSISYSF